MQELIDEDFTGLCFTPGDAVDLARAVRQFVGFPTEKRQVLGKAARERYEEHFTPERNYRRLLEIYEFARLRAVARKRARSQAPSEFLRVTAVEARI